MNDTVSVIITSYNSDLFFLDSAVNSVIKQTYKNIEVILVDDGSSNSISKDIAEKYKGKIKYIYQTNKGLPAARNTGIKSSKGNFICFLDDDDEWEPTKVERQIELFKTVRKHDPKLGLTFTYCNVIDENNNVIGSHGYKVKGHIFKKMLYRNIIGPPSSVMICKNVLNDVGLFNEKFHYAEDLELWYRISMKYSVYSTNEFLINYRWRLNSHSKNAEKMNHFCSLALNDILNCEHIKSIISIEEKEHIINNLLIGLANRYFKANDTKNYQRSYVKTLKHNIKNLIKINLLIKYFTCFLGDSILKKINYKREQYTLQKSFNGIQDFT
ncbi:glycosyltransferase family 2 protein [Fictibacillus iocasae]|uniref:Glycosyltransferase family 2 protein n=1 Tax=Fictibacillus iocasae TaxID=2715437 RepID=A0ABW2NQI4_9BACL